MQFVRNLPRDYYTLFICYGDKTLSHAEQDLRGVFAHLTAKLPALYENCPLPNNGEAS